MLRLGRSVKVSAKGELSLASVHGNLPCTQTTKCEIIVIKRCILNECAQGTPMYAFDKILKPRYNLPPRRHGRVCV